MHSSATTSWSDRLQCLLVEAAQNKHNTWRHHSSNSAAVAAENSNTSDDDCSSESNISISSSNTSDDNMSSSIDDDIIASADTLDIFNSVFIGGSQHTKQQILEYFRRTYAWIEISNVTFQLLTAQYNGNIKLVLNHLLNGRTEPKVYIHSDQEILMHQHVIHKHTKTEQTPTPELLRRVYNECCDCLQETSTSRIVIVIDCRHKYYTQHSTQLYIQTMMFAAMMHKRHLYPFIEFVLVQDDNTNTNNSDDDTFKCLLDLVSLNVQPSDLIMHTLDYARICAIVAYAHKSSFTLN